MLKQALHDGFEQLELSEPRSRYCCRDVSPFNRTPSRCLPKLVTGWESLSCIHVAAHAPLTVRASRHSMTAHHS